MKELREINDADRRSVFIPSRSSNVVSGAFMLSSMAALWVSIVLYQVTAKRSVSEARNRPLLVVSTSIMRISLFSEHITT